MTVAAVVTDVLAFIALVCAVVVRRWCYGLLFVAITTALLSISFAFRGDWLLCGTYVFLTAAFGVSCRALVEVKRANERVASAAQRVQAVSRRIDCANATWQDMRWRQWDQSRPVEPPSEFD